jgi:hypothetical protein
VTILTNNDVNNLSSDSITIENHNQEEAQDNSIKSEPEPKDHKLLQSQANHKSFKVILIFLAVAVLISAFLFGTYILTQSTL